MSEHVKNGHWEEIKEFYYIVGDKTLGFYPELEDELQSLIIEYPHIKFYLKGEDYLHRIFSNIDNLAIMQEILQCFIPAPSLEPINLTIINDIISFLIQETPPISDSRGKLIAPDFEEKITFNNLSAYCAGLLRHANYSCDILETFFNSTNDNSKELLKEYFISSYTKAKKTSNSPDEQFFYIYDNVFPINKDLDNHTQNAYCNNILIIMSLYFESCDIFEPPI